MKKVRIVKRTYTRGKIEYAIQQKHFMFKWWWVEPWMNRGFIDDRDSVFNTFEEAKDNLQYFNGSRTVKEEVLFAN